jgi:hypothetical protein
VLPPPALAGGAPSAPPRGAPAGRHDAKLPPLLLQPAGSSELSAAAESAIDEQLRQGLTVSASTPTGHYSGDVAPAHPGGAGASDSASSPPGGVLWRAVLAWARDQWWRAVSLRLGDVLASLKHVSAPVCIRLHLGVTHLLLCSVPARRQQRGRRDQRQPLHLQPRAASAVAARCPRAARQPVPGRRRRVPLCGRSCSVAARLEPAAPAVGGPGQPD